MAWYAVDGMDGSGKSTVAEIVAEALESRGRRVLVVAHPDRGTFLGRVSARFLVSDSPVSAIGASLFYFLDMLQSVSSLKLRWRKYDDVLFVRYTMAVGYFPGKWSMKVNSFIRKILPFPDCAIFVDVDAATAMERITDRGEELQIFESEEKLASTRESMLSLCDGWIVLDNGGTVEELREAVERVVSGSLAGGG
ncbi:MAG: thymidylate kinase [Thermoplasmatales archaeon]|nr:thymidylate kinase [Thermoplasmatales archaeon]